MPSINLRPTHSPQQNIYETTQQTKTKYTRQAPMRKEIGKIATDRGHIRNAIAILLLMVTFLTTVYGLFFILSDEIIYGSGVEAGKRGDVQAKWTPSDRCATNLYSEQELENFKSRYVTPSAPPPRCKNATDVLNPACVKVFHTCSPYEMEINNALTQPYSLEWTGLQEGAVEKLWKRLYDTKLANIKLFLLGDSMMGQTAAAVSLMLTRMGIHCPNMVCPNGFVVDRPMAVGRVEDQEGLNTVFLRSNITIFNVGLWYSTASCSEDGNHYCKDLTTALGALAQLSKANDIKLIWMDTFRAHFMSNNGTYDSFSKMQTKDPQCAPIDKSIDDAKHFFYEFADQLLETEHNDLPRIRTRDIVRDRWDAHLGVLTWYSAGNPDCLHYCMQPCFWEPILYRIGTMIDSLVK